MTDTWTQKADLPGPERRTACYFALEGTPIAGGGWDGTDYFTDFYVYSPVSDSWTPIPEFEGIGAHTPVSFSVNDLGYVGTGGIPGGETDQYWEYSKGTLTVGDAPRQEAIEAVLGDGRITLLNWTRAKADVYDLYDAGGRLVASGTLRTNTIVLARNDKGLFMLRLSGTEGGQRIFRFAVLNP